MSKVIHAPLLAQEIETLRAGDSVLLSGVLYTGRDAARCWRPESRCPSICAIR